MREKNKNRLFVSAENDFRKMYKSHIRMIYLLITTEKHASSYSSKEFENRPKCLHLGNVGKQRRQYEIVTLVTSCDHI